MFHGLTFTILLISSDLVQEATCSKGEFSPFYPFFSFLKTHFLITINAMYILLVFLSLKSPSLIEISLLMKIVIKERRFLGLFAL